ncbi:MAG TPA: arginine--tRNA ligase [Pseudobdellovibrionaceae bacterium]|nr:arginine--tRNA ligase [Pseudobdellovibrionaceae bacterium]
MLNDIKKTISLYLKSKINLDEAQIYNLLEVPKVYEHGHLSLPLFQMAKLEKTNPMELAKNLQAQIEKEYSEKLGSEKLGSEELQSKNRINYGIEKVQAVGGYLNITLQSSFFQENVVSGILSKKQIGFSQEGVGQKVAVDFSSPNVAKPMHVGHLRATMIGNAICNLAESQGYEVLSINHLGDWGSQFGKLAWAYKQWGSEYDFSERPIDAFLKIYIRFHEEAEKDPTLVQKGTEQFRRLEEGDLETRQIWELIIKYSMADFSRLYKILGIHHKFVLGESFYNDKLEDVVQRLKDKNLLQESEGAQVVFFDEKENMPPCLIKKSDGASIYATRDLAAAIYRHEEMKAHKLLYVVGQDQTLHFKQVFRVLEKMGYEWAKEMFHITFGLYRFKDGKLSTRQGKIVLFEDILNQSMDLVREMIEEKNPNLNHKELVTQQVAIGAVIFNDLVNDRSKNVEFDWDRAISIEGDSGPYVQYTVVRCRSLMRKFGKPVKESFETLLQSPEEQKLLFRLLQLDHVLKISFNHFKPNFLAQYLLEVCSDFSHFYHAHRILGESEAIESSRMTLVLATEKILTQGLQILGIPTPDEM